MEQNEPLLVEYWPLDRIKPYAKNARKISKAAVDKVAKSIQEFGFRQPIVVAPDGVIIVGHVRRMAAAQLGLNGAPVHVATGLTEAQVRQYRLMDNRSHEEARWDADILTLEMQDMQLAGMSLELTGFSGSERDRSLAKPQGEEDAIPGPPKVPTTVRGDLWVMGDHRLLCGDATSEPDVARLMNGEKAGLMATDPPYGISYDSADLHEHGVSYARIDGDHHEDRKLQEFLEKCFRAALTALRPNAAWYLWHAMLSQGFFAAAAAANVILHRQIIWNKPVLVFGRGQYHWKHELCFMGWVKGNEPPDYGNHTDVTVWDIPGVALKDRREFEHSTPKPVELFRRPIAKHLQRSEIAFEPFSGTGPQFIAAEATGRRCFGVEIEPLHCDVIVRRWEAFTGRKAARAQ